MFAGSILTDAIFQKGKSLVSSIKLRLQWSCCSTQDSHDVMSLTGAYDKDGERVVGGSLRADGSVRPVAKVRPGYVAKEDVPKFKPRAVRERDAKLGIASAPSPVVAATTEEPTRDSGAAIKARIQAMKLEFERKKLAKGVAESVDRVESTKNSDDKTVIKESVKESVNRAESARDSVKSPVKPITDSVDDLAESLGDMTVKEKAGVRSDDKIKDIGTKSGTATKTKTPLKSRHARPAATSQANEVPSLAPSKSTASPDSDSRPKLSSRHGRANQDTHKEDNHSKDEGEKKGYVPPHKRK